MATLKIDLTELGLFSGLYNSIWEDETPLQEEMIQACEDIFEDCIFSTQVRNLDNFFKDIAELYCNVLENNLKGVFEFDSYFSPSFYNYDTDHIYLTWNVEDKTEDEMEDMLETFLTEIDNLADFEIFAVFDYLGNGYNIIDNNYDIIMTENGNEYIVKDICEDGVELQSI